MREAFTSAAAITSVILDYGSSLGNVKEAGYIDEVIFIWIKPYVRNIGGQNYVCRSVAYRNTRTRQVRIHTQRFEHIRD